MATNVTTNAITNAIRVKTVVWMGRCSGPSPREELQTQSCSDIGRYPRPHRTVWCLVQDYGTYYWRAKWGHTLRKGTLIFLFISASPEAAWFHSCPEPAGMCLYVGSYKRPCHQIGICRSRLRTCMIWGMGWYFWSHIGKVSSLRKDDTMLVLGVFRYMFVMIDLL